MARGRRRLDHGARFAGDGGPARQIRAAEEDRDDGDGDGDGRELPGERTRLVVDGRVTAAEAERAESIRWNVDRLRLGVRRSPRREARWRRGLDLHLRRRLRGELNGRRRERSRRRRLVRGRCAVPRRRRDARRIHRLWHRVRPVSARTRELPARRLAQVESAPAAARTIGRGAGIGTGTGASNCAARCGETSHPVGLAGRGGSGTGARWRSLLLGGGRTQLVLARARGLLLLALLSPRRCRVLVGSGLRVRYPPARRPRAPAGSAARCARAPARARRAPALRRGRCRHRCGWRVIDQGLRAGGVERAAHRRRAPAVQWPPVPRRPPGLESGPRCRPAPLVLVVDSRCDNRLGLDDPDRIRARGTTGAGATPGERASCAFAITSSSGGRS